MNTHIVGKRNQLSQFNKPHRRTKGSLLKKIGKAETQNITHTPRLMKACNAMNEYPVIHSLW
ncbi:hypothetical protein LX64_02936 [Chitinophaga skermanii]|uniref:Uncharacterized protein n=1 Tax=Chitinophaga skermanii TaxID=331697 RepID=A0A327QHN0_9BACT|nr:hypothetical protein LX64_02936 [Chitinophaga skermanii]